ncbi:ATP-binding protein [Actinoallomurus sp. NPDC050550]|uniref:AAA family ATPase n=1 Tax=Actinoallomurus sp. NPDC050550 TaxID=3154937 RepID=UPI0033DFC36B
MVALEKPERVFDRSFEWSALARFATSVSPHARLGLVSGRRRQGKTFVLRALAEATGGFYFTAVEATATDSLREFGAALAEHAGSRAPYALTDWGDALRVLGDIVGDGLAIIDEFPYLIKADGAIPSIFQRRLDELASRPGETSPRFLLCGSAMSVMGRLLAANAPPRGRASMELLVKPFDYRTAAEFWQIDDPKLAALVHSIVGGTPAYRQEFVGGDTPESLADFDDWVMRTVLSSSVPLFREARYLLAEETDIRDPALYNSVLGAIAAGNATRGGIANYIGRKSSELMHPLNVLEDAGLITRESDPFHARRSRFRITEPLITFYEAVMRRAWTQLEQRQAAQVWKRSRPTFLAQVVGPHFESLCRAWAVQADGDVFGDLPGEVAAGAVADSANRTQIEVDVAVLSSSDERRILSLGEAKWGVVMGMRHLDRLRRARDLLSVKGYDTSETWLACYSGAGFDDELRAAAQRDRVLLVDLDRLYAG